MKILREVLGVLVQLENKGENMKLILSVMALVMLVSCSSSPTIIRAKNCQQIGNTEFYDCEEVNKKEVEKSMLKH